MTAPDYQQAFEKALSKRFTPNAQGEVTTQCPFHPDDNPSLSINTRKGVWCCHAGCGQGGLKDFIFRLGAQNPSDHIAVPSFNTEIEEYHAQLNEHAREYWHKRGIEDTVLNSMKVGFKSKAGYYVIPYFDASGNCPAYKCLHPNKDIQEFWHPKGADFIRLLNICSITEARLTGKTLIIAEGEKDAFVLIQAGYSCVGVSGAGGFKSQYAQLFDGVNDIVVAYDHDAAGTKGARTVARALGPKCRILDWTNLRADLRNGFDVNDLYLENPALFQETFNRLMSCAKPITPSTDLELALDIYLTDIENSDYWNKKVNVEFTVTGIGGTFTIASEFEVVWQEITEEITARGKTGTSHFTLPRNHTIIIKLCEESEEKRDRALSNYAKDQIDFPVKILSVKVLKTITVRQIVALPKLEEIRATSTSTMISDKCKEYRHKVITLVGKEAPAHSYKATGYVVADPKTAEATLIVTECQPIQEQFENFKITKEVRESLKVFVKPDGMSYQDHLARLVGGAVNFIDIRGRDNAIVAYLLCYHSPLYFYFDGQLVNGWLQIVGFGDTTTGKSTIANKIRAYTGAGVYAVGETCTRTGFLYGIDCKMLSAKNVLKWGLLPRQDKRLLIVDGANYISREDWGEAREARRQGKLVVQRIEGGEHPCRTRLIVIANPVNPLDRYSCPIEAIKDIFQEPDIARTDLCVCFSQSDVEQSLINSLKEEHTPPEVVINQEALRDSIYRAWSRTVDQIVFMEGASQAVSNAADELQSMFGSVPDIPLVSNDMKNKVARLSAAFACFLMSTDETFEKVLVTEEIVELATNFIKQVYTAPNCLYDQYAKDSRVNLKLSEQDYQRIKDGYEEEMKKDRSLILAEIMDIFKSTNSIRLNELCARLEKPESTMKDKLVFFKKYGLIRSGKSGYSKTPKFIQFLGRANRERQQTSAPPSSPSPKTVTPADDLGTHDHPEN